MRDGDEEGYERIMSFTGYEPHFGLRFCVSVVFSASGGGGGIVSWHLEERLTGGFGRSVTRDSFSFGKDDIGSKS